MPAIAYAIIDGPDKPDLLRSLAHPGRQNCVTFKTDTASIEVVIERMDALDNGLDYILHGKVAAGEHEGRSLEGTYSAGKRAGMLSVEA